MTKKSKIMLGTAISAAAIGVTLAGSTFAATENATARGERRGEMHTQMTADERAAHETEMKTRMTEMLDAKVADKSITAEQKAHILEVMDQIHTKMEASDFNGADALREELHAWEEAQGIDDVVRPGRGAHGEGTGPKDGTGFRGNHNRK